MSIIIKNIVEIELMRKSGKILAFVLNEIKRIATSGMSTYELDQYAEKLIRQKGGVPGFKGYRNFPGTLCTCVNEEIVHGIPRKEKILQEGDILTVDCGVKYKGLYTDAARSFSIGKTSKLGDRLIKTAYKALSYGIDQAKPGNHVNKISKAIEKVINMEGFKVIKDLTGHGVGRKLHEDPIILNFDDHKPGPILKPGMTIAIEPIFSAGTHNMKTLSDNWTIITSDHSLSVQAEETVLITNNGNEILTKR